MNSKPTWELVTEHGFSDRNGSITHRLPVPGGWLYRTIVREYTDDSGPNTGVSTTFVPDVSSVFKK